ncbi:hypothetical protein BH23VER1_BH23VER1_35780 [soil metagenome]
MTLRLFLRPALALVVAIFLPVAHASADDVSELTDGVESIDKPGAPGPLVVWGERAFPVVVGKSGSAVEPLVAAARWGEGRVVAFGHNGYLNSTGEDSVRFRRNALRWAAGKAGEAKVSAALWNGAERLGAELEAAGMRVERAELDRLARYDVVILDTGALTEEKDRERVRKFVESGGGLVCGSLGWGWLQLNGGTTIQDHPGNALLAGAGIAWADGTLDPTAPGDAYAARPDGLAHAGRALRILVSDDPGEIPGTQALAVISRALRTIAHDAPGFGDALAALLAAGGESPPVPTPEEPVGEDDVLGRVLLSVACGRVATADPESLGAHPAAADFPGGLGRGAAPVTADVPVSTSTPGWQSLGLYAGPGALVQVRVPEEAAAAGLEVRVGCHSDRLYHKERWERPPEISFVWPLREVVTTVANPFGGLVYVVVPDRCTLGEITVEVAGAVESPLYVLGETPAPDWRESVRSTAAPWVEFASERVIVSVPTAVARSVRDPQELMEAWDKVLELEDELATITKSGERPERIVCDRQISAGYMHSGYPVMVGMDQAENLASAAHLTGEGNWGIFHEFGHNHQRGEWTFDGTVEVTCNLFTLYVYEKLCGVPPEEHERGNKVFREARMREYFAFGRGSFERWKKKPFVALVPYIQLQQEFGWEAYKKVFAEYESLPDGARPKTDDEKRDQWMVRFSKAVGHNLGPFFQAWAIPVSDGALAEVADLERWMPAELERFLRE